MTLSHGCTRCYKCSRGTCPICHPSEHRHNEAIRPSPPPRKLCDCNICPNCGGLRR